MYSWENPKDRVAIVQMNAELRHAQLELLSAQCATQQLRLRFSAEDLAHYAQRDLLRKALDAASALHEYYSSIKKLIPDPASGAKAAVVVLTEEQVRQGTALVLGYLREQRERFFALGHPLSLQYKAAMRPFFSTGILDRIRVVELKGVGLPNPSFYPDAEAMGLANLPPVAHMASLTFLDVVIFNERITERTLFHGLVHAVQVQILGPELYSDLYVQAFLRTGSHVNIPLESHAFALDSRFAQKSEQSFSVEEQVRLWVRESRY
jgi:hypothetical protein